MRGIITRNLLIAIMLVTLVVSGCRDRTICPSRIDDLPPAMYIDEPILFETLGLTAPDTTGEVIYVFGFGGFSGRAPQRVNGFEVHHGTPIKCDHDVWVFNHETY